MERISVLFQTGDPLELGLPDLVLFSPHVKIEYYGIEGFPGRTFIVLRVDGKMKLTDNEIHIYVDWLTKGYFSLSQSVVCIINIDQRRAWLNPQLCEKCMKIMTDIQPDDKERMRCSDCQHSWALET